MRWRSSEATPRIPRTTGVVVSALVMLVGLAASIAFAVHADSSFNETENRLLRMQAQLTKAAIEAADPQYVTAHVGAAARAASATHEPARQFGNFLGGSAGKKGPFSSVSLWRIANGAPRLVVSAGAAPTFGSSSASGKEFLLRASKSATFLVNQVVTAHANRLVYASGWSGPLGTYVAYAEEPLPPNRRISIPARSPLVDFNLALYLGRSTSSSDLLETNADRPLPLRGRTYSTSIPFGDRVITLVMSPRQPISGELGEEFPWIVAGVGGALSLLAGALVLRLVRGRRRAELLADMNASLYRRHREISETLQQSLLPRELPRADGIEFAARYLPGAAGLEVGGDWYSVIEVAPERFVFVIGDVSGHGLEAATIMASLRYTTRTLAQLGIAPAEILEQVGKEADFHNDEHFATVLVGVIDLEHDSLEIASAGHLPVLLVNEGVAEFLAPSPRPPLGVFETDYQSARFSFPRGSALLAFTDGLIERRGEMLDDGLERLRVTASRVSGSAEEFVSAIVTAFSGNDTDDDLAVLGIRRTG